MTLLEDNKRQQEYLHTLRVAITNVSIKAWIAHKTDPGWKSFINDTQEAISQTMILIERELRTKAKLYGCKERLKRCQENADESI